MAVSLKGRTALITGGGSGIGKAIAAAFVAEGANVVIAGRSRDRVEAAAAELGPQVTPIAADVTDEDDVARLFAATIEQHGAVDVLVNSAAVFAGAVVDDQDIAAWRAVIDTNVTGTFLAAREAFRHMRPRGGGRILNIGSVAAFRSRENAAAYTTSKHAVWGLTQSLAIDGRDDGIVVSCLNPGNTMVGRRAPGRPAETGREDDAEPMMPAEEVARVAVMMVTMDDDINLLEALVLPSTQRYIGRG